MGELVQFEIREWPRYTITNPNDGEYYVWRTLKKGAVPFKVQTQAFNTLAEARQFLRNTAIKDARVEAFEPGQWQFTATQAMTEHGVQPARMPYNPVK